MEWRLQTASTLGRMQVLIMRANMWTATNRVVQTANAINISAGTCVSLFSWTSTIATWTVKFNSCKVDYCYEILQFCYNEGTLTQKLLKYIKKLDMLWISWSPNLNFILLSSGFAGKKKSKFQYITFYCTGEPEFLCTRTNRNY